MTRTLRLAKPPLVIRVSSFFEEQLKDFWLERVRCNLKRPRHTSVQFSVIGGAEVETPTQGEHSLPFEEIVSHLGPFQM